MAIALFTTTACDATHAGTMHTGTESDRSTRDIIVHKRYNNIFPSFEVSQVYLADKWKYPSLFHQVMRGEGDCD